MTVVVGIRGKGGVLLAADAQWSGDNGNRMGRDAKVHSVFDTVAVGCCGNPRFAQILQYELHDQLEQPSLTMDEEYWTIREFIPRLRSATEAHGHLHVHHNVETFGPSAFLIGVRARLFCIESDFSVFEHRLPYEAVGSGEETAIGVLHSIFGDGTESISDGRREAAARKAVEAASDLTNFVGGDVTYIETIQFTDEEKVLARRILGRR